MRFLFYYYLLLNLLVFVLMLWDKLSAIRHWWRVPESRLLFGSLLGGGAGGLLGMLLARHKIRKTIFWLVNIGSILLHIAIIFMIYRFAA